MREVAKYKYCFVCGDDNECGLKAQFYLQEDGLVVSELTPDDRFQGYRDVLHGGVISAMMDEVMIKAVLARDIFAVTAEISVKFKRPARTGELLRFVGRIVEAKRRITRTEGIASDAEGNVIATGTATYVEARGELKDILESSVVES